MKLAFRRILPVAIPVVILNLFFLQSSGILLSLGAFDNEGGYHVIAYSCTASFCYPTGLGFVLQNGLNHLIPIASGVGGINRIAGLVTLDIISLCCILVLARIFYRCYSNQGRSFALLKMAQLTDLAVMPLGIELWLADYLLGYHYLGMQVATIQRFLGPLAKFTNLDFLFSSIFLFFLSTLLIQRISRGRVISR